ncbi:MAG: flavodoxin family protein [Deltaproteobacteria bacterium]|nr:flavodoxin family protein [Deltaproteobacteria bacterium]
MKAVILNGARKDDNALDSVHKIIVDELTGIGWQVKSFALREIKIAYCLGCFDCWVKTPGVCRFNDDGREIAGQFIQSNLSILFTPVTFGGYSAELKKALDRIICLLLPFFMRINGEVHHKLRYERYPRVMGVGVLPQADEESERIFKTLVNRNALNLHPPAHVGGVVLSSQTAEEIRKEIQTLLTAIEVIQ